MAKKAQISIYPRHQEPIISTACSRYDNRYLIWDGSNAYITEVRNTDDCTMPYHCYAGYQITSGYTASGKHRRIYYKVWIATAINPHDYTPVICPGIPMRDSYDLTLERDVNWIMTHKALVEEYFGELNELRLSQMAVCRTLRNFELYRNITIDDYSDMRIAYVDGLWIFNWGY